MQAKTVKESRSELTQAMELQHANLAGLVHGGVIMKLVDTAAGLAAVRHAGIPVVTAAIDEMSFHEPVPLGSLVTLKASVNAVGTTSMEIGVRVETENVLTGERAHTSSAYLVYVALDDNQRPRPVPGLIAETPEEERRMREAGLRRKARLARRQAILAARAGPGESEE